jgi:hypothetical protein
MKPWQCEVGDFVEFHVSEWSKMQEKAPLKGTIVSRAAKLVEIEMLNGNKMTVHVSLVNILKAVPRVKVLARKFEEKPKNVKKTVAAKKGNWAYTV